jgi:phosphatidylserine decarboxylase
VKGSTISIDLLLHSPIAAQLYDKGAALVLRLAPQDYHRFHFPDSGVAEPTRTIPGRYHSVNPIALARVPDVFCCNKRTVTDFQSRHFGPIAYIEIGAFRVGSIVQTYVPGEVTKGQEKGYFQFGGSTIIVLFAPDSIVFDADLMEDSAQGLEVAVKAGSHIGVCTP